MVLNKNAMQSTHGGPGSLLDQAKKYLYEHNENDFLHVVHRIDRSASGAVVFAKNATAAKHMSKAFATTGAVRKKYVAILQVRSELALQCSVWLCYAM